MKTFILFGFFALFFSTVFSFAGNDGWTLYKSVDGVQIYSKVIPCTANTSVTNNNKEITVFKFVNTTAKDLSVSWTYDVWYGGNCRTCGLSEANKKDYTHTLKIKANKTTEGTCNDKLDSGLILYTGTLNKQEQKKLTKFEMNNLIVTISK